MWNIAAMICFLKYFKIIFFLLSSKFSFGFDLQQFDYNMSREGCVCVCLCVCVCVCVSVYVCMFILCGVVGASFVCDYAYDLCMHPQ